MATDFAGVLSRECMIRTRVIEFQFGMVSIELSDASPQRPRCNHRSSGRGRSISGQGWHEKRKPQPR